MHGDPSCLHPSEDPPSPNPKSTPTFKVLPFKSIPMQTCKPTKWHTLYNWLRIRAHGVLLNLWRLCIMLESVEIMQRQDIMPPFSLIASVLFPCLCYGEHPTHFILFFSLILYLILFSLSSQFPSVVLHPLFLSLHYSLSFAPLLFTLPPPLHFSSLGPLAVSPQVMFSWPDDACISLVSS